MKYPSEVLLPSVGLLPETDGTLSPELLAVDFLAAKASLNLLMTKRSYGQRPMNSYQVTATVSRGDKALPPPPNNLLKPYQRMVASEPKTTPIDLFHSKELIEGNEFNKMLSHIEKYTNFDIYNNNYKYSDWPKNFDPIPTAKSLEVGCGGYCAGLCTTTCSSGCKTSCKNSCGDGCQALCSGSCSILCQGCTGCVGGCATACTSCTGCGGGCYGACTRSCAEKCHADCTGDCFQDCTTGCQLDCDDDCASRCNDDCYGSCAESCEGKCKGDCDTGSKSSYCSCSGECMKNCSGNCSSNCTSHCDSGCKDMCDKKCKNSCSGTCEGECDHGCQGHNEQSICGSFCTTMCGYNTACEGGCSTTCFGICQGSCSTVCSQSCGYGCEKGCSGQVTQFDWGAESLPYSSISVLTNNTTIFTVPAEIYSIYVFAVGGGGGSAGMYIRSQLYSSENLWYYYEGSGGGGGGYTNHAYFNVQPGDIVKVEIGVGGSAGPKSTNINATKAGDGGITKVYINGILQLVAAGGFASGTYFDSNGNRQWSHNSGGYGGSSGGAAITMLEKGTNMYSMQNNGGWNGLNGLAWEPSAITALGQRNYIPASVKEIIINDKTYSGSSGDSTACMYNGVLYGSGGGGGGSHYYSSSVDSKYNWYDFYGGNSTNGGGHGQNGAYNGLKAGTNGTGGGAGGTASGWDLTNPSHATNGVEGGNGVVVICY